MANNKVQLANGTVLMDLTGDTVTADKILAGYTAHDRSGTLITGTATAGAQIATGTFTIPGADEAYFNVGFFPDFIQFYGAYRYYAGEGVESSTGLLFLTSELNTYIVISDIACRGNDWDETYGLYGAYCYKGSGNNIVFYSMYEQELSGYYEYVTQTFNYRAIKWS